MSFEGFPFIVGWELTLACNIRCRHCASSAGLPRPDELTLKEALAICDQFPALLVKEVDFTGGEPLLRPDWPEIAAYLANLGITTRILTNGLALTQETIERIKDAGIATVGLSLDGLEQTHDYIRGHQGLFRSAVTNIERAVAAGVSISVITTVNGRNLDELPPLLEVLQSIGVKLWQVQPIFPFGRCKKDTELRLTTGEYMELGAFFCENKPKAKEADLEMLPADGLGYFTELDTFKPPWRGCSAGMLSCGITSDGKIKGCLSLPDEMIEGDLRQNDLWDIWFHPDSFAYTRQFSREKLGPNCHSCDKGDQCRGGCSTISYGYTGQFNNSPYCFYGIKERNL